MEGYDLRGSTESFLIITVPSYLESDLWLREQRIRSKSMMGCANEYESVEAKIVKTAMGFVMSIKNGKGEIRTFELQVPFRCLKALTAIAGQEHEHVGSSKEPDEVQSYTVMIKKISKGYGVMMAIPLQQLPLLDWDGKRLGSMVLNSHNIDAVIVDATGSPIAARTFGKVPSISVRANKRRWPKRNMLERTLDWMHYWRVVALVVEKSKVDVRKCDRNIRKLMGCHKHRQIQEAIRTKTLRRELVLIEAPSANTRGITAAKYKKLFPGMSSHQLTALGIARGALGCKEKPKTEQLRQVTELIPKRQAKVKKELRHMNKTDRIILSRLHEKTLKVDSSTGTIFSNRRSWGTGSWQKLKGTLAKGYIMHRLAFQTEKTKHALAHRIVWMAKYGRINTKMLVHHKNHNRTDNRLINLEMIPRPRNTSGRRKAVTKWMPELERLDDLENESKNERLFNDRSNECGVAGKLGKR